MPSRARCATGAVGLKLKQSLVAGDGGGVIFVGGMGIRQRLPQIDVIGGKIDGPLETGGGPAELAVAAECQAAVYVNLGHIGGKTDRFGISRMRLGPATQGAKRIAEVVVARREIGLAVVRLPGNGRALPRHRPDRVGPDRNWREPRRRRDRGRRPSERPRRPHPSCPGPKARCPGCSVRARTQDETRSAARNCSAASSRRPSACKARPRLLRASGHHRAGVAGPSWQHSTASFMLPERAVGLSHVGVKDGRTGPKRPRPGRSARRPCSSSRTDGA